jgi:hypothetical protein
MTKRTVAMGMGVAAALAMVAWTQSSAENARLCRAAYLGDSC